MYDDTIRANCAKKSESVPEQCDSTVVIESEPGKGVEKGGKDNDDMADPPEELLMLDDSLKTLCEVLRGRD
jgi:hypothetical protein